MANYQTHITVSGLLGVGYGLSASFGAGFNGVQAALAGCLTGIAGMLPDLDSDTGRPVREVFGVASAVGPLVLMNRLETWGGSRDAGLLLAVLVYITLRFGVANLLSLVSVHRGMFHSIPAMIVAAELTFLAYQHATIGVRLLMALGVAVGFASHLVLDEIYSVQWDGTVLKLKSSAGTALKFLGDDWGANCIAYGLLFTLGYVTLTSGGAWQSVAGQAAPHRPPQATHAAQAPHKASPRR